MKRALGSAAERMLKVDRVAAAAKSIVPNNGCFGGRRVGAESTSMRIRQTPVVNTGAATVTRGRASQQPRDQRAGRQIAHRRPPASMGNTIVVSPREMADQYVRSRTVPCASPATADVLHATNTPTFNPTPMRTYSFRVYAVAGVVVLVGVAAASTCARSDHAVSADRGCLRARPRPTQCRPHRSRQSALMANPRVDARHGGARRAPRCRSAAVVSVRRRRLVLGESEAHSLGRFAHPRHGCSQGDRRCRQHRPPTRRAARRHPRER